MKRNDLRRRKLNLNQETIQLLALSQGQLAKVAGGSIETGCFFCPTVASGCCTRLHLCE